MGRVFVIGLAGGIGSGKSTVAAEFGRRGAEVLDADAMVHELLRERAIIAKIVRRFGKEVLKSRGGIDREKLAAIAFGSGRKIRDLEAILHPPVVRRMKRRIAALRRAGDRQVVVIDAPLLFEAKLDALCDEIMFVDVPKTERVKRLRRSRGWTRTVLEKREKRQKPLDYKRENADTVMRNADAEGRTRTQVRKHWRRIRQFLSD